MSGNVVGSANTLTVRAKMLGVLLKDARSAAGKTVRECAAVLGCSLATYTAYETGRKTLSLPQLELLAHFFDVPVSHFWGEHLITTDAASVGAPVATLLPLRDRIIGALLRQARQTAGYKLKTLAAELGLPPSRLSAYEFGQKPVPLPELEMIAARLGVSLDDLCEPRGPTGEREEVRRAWERLRQLSPDLREFILQPDNEHYLRLAQRLSQMPTAQLRSIAESLLDITY